MANPGTVSGVELVPNFIGGKWVEANGSELFNVHNPATGEVIAKVPLSGQEEVHEAVAAAARAFPGWRRLHQQFEHKACFASSNSWMSTLKSSSSW